jgi:glycosyltransferase involved in cell wall biosynthesis
MNDGCIIITHPYSMSVPGGGTMHCMYLAQHIERLGIKVILVPVGTEQCTKMEEPGLDVVSTLPSRIHYLLDGIGILRNVREILKQRNVNGILGWSHEAAFLPAFLRSQKVVFGMIAAASYGVWLTRQTPVAPVKRLADKWFRCRPLKSADIVFASSNFTRRELIDLVKVRPDRIVVAPQGVARAFTRIHRSYDGEISRFIFFGSFAAIKGIFDVIEALGKVYSMGYRNWTLRVAGWGDHVEILRAVSQWGITDLVVMLGQLDHSALLHHLSWAQLAILPSHTESFGLAIAEAQGAALPVVAYETDAVPEVVEKDVSGWLVPPNRADLLAEAILEAMRKPEQAYRMGLSGRERVNQLFSWDRAAAAILEGISISRKSNCPSLSEQTDSP